MASFNSTLTSTFISAADYSATPYRLVYISAADTVTTCKDADGTGFRPVGILTDQVGAASGDAVSVQMAGIAKVEAGAVVAAGDLIVCDSVGRGITSTAAGDFVVGIALEAASGAGVIFSLAMQSFTISSTG